jgi:hypothetical protein
MRRQNIKNSVFYVIAYCELRWNNANMLEGGGLPEGFDLCRSRMQAGSVV